MGITMVNGTSNNNTFKLSQTTTAAGSRPKSGNTTGAADPDSTSGGTAAAAQGASNPDSGKTTTAAGSGSGLSGGAAVGAGMVAQYFDKKDLNEDGTVTAAEEMEYDLKHPGEASSDNATYTQQGKAEGKPAVAGNTLDIYA